MAAYKGKLSHIDFSQQAYRGYLIRVNALTGAMWVEKDGFCICHVAPPHSWDWARKQIDMLVQS